MKRQVGFLFSCLIVLSIGITSFATTGFAFDSDPDKEKKKGQGDELVIEIAPGKRLYGKTPEFAEVGHANMFDLSPDGQKIAFLTHKGVRFWDLEKGKLDEHDENLLQSKHRSPGQHFEYSPDGLKLFVSYWANQTIRVVEEGGENEDPQPTQVINQGHIVEVRSALTGDVITQVNPVSDEKDQNRHLSFLLSSPDGDMVLLGYGQRSEIYDSQTGELIRKLKHKSWLQSAVFDHEGKRLIDGRGKIIDIETGETLGKLPRMVFGQHLNAMKFHPKKNIIAATEWSKGVTLYDMDEKEKIELEVAKSIKQQQLYNIEFSPDGKLLAAASHTNWQAKSGKPMIVVWEVETGKIVDEVEISGGYLARFRFSADNKFIFSKSHGQYGLSKYVIDRKRGDSTRERTITNPIQRFQFVDSDEQIMACPQQGDAILFDLETGKSLKGVGCQNNSYLEISESGEYAVLGANYSQVKIHNTQSGKTKSIQVKSFSRPSVVSRLGSFLTRKKNQPRWENFSIGSVVISDDDQFVLVALRGTASFRWQKLRIKNGESVEQQRFKFSDYWDVDSESQNNNQYHWTPGSATISPDGRYFAIMGPKNRLYVVDAESGDDAFDFEVKGFHHGSAVFFSRDSEKLFVKHQNTLKVIDVESGEESNELDIGQNHAFGLSRDRTKAAFMKSSPQRVVVYDLDSQEELFSKKAKQGYVAIGVSNDGEKLALARSTCQFEVWDVNEID